MKSATGNTAPTKDLDSPSTSVSDWEGAVLKRDGVVTGHVHSLDQPSLPPRTRKLRIRAMAPPALIYANHDPAHCCAPGLFQSFPKGQRKALELDLKYQYNAETLIEFKGPALGVDDMRVLQCLIAFASASAANREFITKTSTGVCERELWTQLKLTAAAKEKKIIAVNVDIKVLLNEMGRRDVDGGAAYRSVRESVERMSMISITVTRNCASESAGESLIESESYRLLSKYSDVADNGVLAVGLNPLLSAAILSPRVKRSYYRINMDEVRGLKTDVARLLHQRLQWMPNTGEGRVFKWETLCNYVWTGEANANAMSYRLTTIGKAVAELYFIGWSSTHASEGMVRIWRPVPSRRRPVKAAEDAVAKK